MRRAVLTALKLLVTGGLLWLLLRNLDFASAANRLANADASWLWIVALLTAAQIGVLVLRWQLVVRLQIGPIPLREAFHSLMVGVFFNQVLPSGIGGDAVRIWLLTRKYRGYLHQAVMAVLIERGTGLLALMTIAVVVSPWLIWGPVGDSLQDAGTVTGLMGSLAVALIGGYAFLAAVRGLPAFAPRWWQSVTAAYGDVRRAAIGSSLSLPILLLGAAGHVTLLLAIAAFAKALSIPISVVSVVVLTPPAMILASLPLSIAGWGVREAGFTAILALVGVTATDATLLGLSVGFMQLAQGLVGGLVWVAGRRAEQERAQSAEEGRKNSQ